MLDNHSAYLKNCQTVNQLDKEQELNPTLLNLHFLALSRLCTSLWQRRRPLLLMDLYSVVLGMTILQWAEYLGLIIIPVVSSKDTIFMKRILEKSHSMFILKNQDLLTSNHLRLSQTLQAAIRGITCVDCSGMQAV